jgi:hypothetical protein
MLFDEGLAEKFAGSVQGVYKAGFTTALGRFTLEKFVRLVWIVDQLKSAQILRDDPLLFMKVRERRDGKTEK